MKKPCKYCVYIDRSTINSSAYDRAAYAKCPVINARVNINSTCVDDEKRLAYTGKMHFLDIDLEDGK